MLLGMIGLVTLALISNILYYEKRYMSNRASPRTLDLAGWKVKK